VVWVGRLIDPIIPTVRDNNKGEPHPRFITRLCSIKGEVSTPLPFNTKKGKNKKMKKVAFGILAAGLIATGVQAQEVPSVLDGVSVSVGAERELETEVNSLYSSISLGVLSATTTFADTAADQASFSLNKFELDIEQPVGPVTVYVQNDFDKDFKHTETVIGGKITF